MAAARYVEIDGKRYTWSEILRLRREQRNAARQPQPTLFPLKDDFRPHFQRSIEGRFNEPSLFDT